MNTRGTKLLLFALIIMLFSLMLVNVASWLAIIAGIVGLCVAWFGLNRND